VPYVFETLRRLRVTLEPEAVPLLGFAGAPWTLAAYLVEGHGSRHFPALKRMMHREPDVLRALLARLEELTIAYLNAQIAAGAQVVQLFDTWAGLLSRTDYRRWVLPSHRAIVARVDRARAPFVLYVNDGAHVLDSMTESGADVLSLDHRVELADAARRVGGRASLQGNLDPCALAAPRETIFAAVRAMAREAAGARGWIANLGHGCLPDTPVEGVRAFTDAVRALAERP
jgi:uroporphyrinogen decarboxylase